MLTRGKISSADAIKPIWRSVSLDIPTGILCVLQKDTKNEIPILAGLAKYYPLDVEFAELLKIGWHHEVEPLYAEEALKKLKTSYPDLSPEETEQDNQLIRYYVSSKLKGRIGMMDWVTNPDCGLDQNLHLSCTGILRKGIRKETQCDLKKLLREQKSDVEIKAAIRSFVLDTEVEL
jgi:molybdenum cofactor biosynthesis enzyme MoaA